MDSDSFMAALSSLSLNSISVRITTAGEWSLQRGARGDADGARTHTAAAHQAHTVLTLKKCVICESLL